MTQQRARRAAWALWIATIAVSVGSVVFSFTHQLEGSPMSGIANLTLAVALQATFSTVGAVVATRRPRNPIGWIFSFMGLGFALAVLLGNYGDYGLRVEPGSLFAAEYSAWVLTWAWPVMLSPIALILLLFPDGAPPTSRWEWVRSGWRWGVVSWFCGAAFAPGPMANAGLSTPNPFGIQWLRPVDGVLATLGGLTIVVAFAAGAVSMIVRYRRASGAQRSQVKWLAYAAMLVLCTATISISAESTRGEGALVQILQQLLVLSLAVVPIAVGIAILRHRLYDIDRLIGRTIVYGSVTALLAGGYGLLVLSLQTVLPVPEDSPLIVATSTLAVVALFRPLRARLQDFVDRRFYRSRYDAQETIEGFGSRVRRLTELDTVVDDLVSVTRATMHPAHVSLWLRGGSTTGRRP